MIGDVISGYYYFHHRRGTEVMFSPLSVYLSICLSVCRQGISKRGGQIITKLDGQVWSETRTNSFDFGEDVPLGLGYICSTARIRRPYAL